ncbi:uncharacterized protein MYCFIDRAFT_158466 [Pseudocercospora fijiensis CIRAD86]|uniref:Uncharacterized protein n=1 Tax=Pseudocercospora fijiensis (strain CIRAD86) TaxID=383855 RepID=N1Q8K7_PSEFD|nr:uncharacterized protein MYCFIDRAFT_158466 [Pseudocercospora fijiensis CIRAD86]EME87203.1 hypothetical protein MYCFIDRAFT_158466 [Pseudocercospora fijiensis CIRAD86]
MQTTRFATMLRQQAPTLRSRVQPSIRMQARGFRTTQIRQAVPKEEQSAHTISQRLRTLKKIPPELIPLGVVLAAALIAAGYSMTRKLMTDKTLRLSRQGKQAEH